MTYKDFVALNAKTASIKIAENFVIGTHAYPSSICLLPTDDIPVVEVRKNTRILELEEIVKSIVGGVLHVTNPEALSEMDFSKISL